MDWPKISPLGDKALLITLSQEISEETNEIVLRACHEIEAAGVPGIEEAQPAYSSFCIHFDPSRVSAAWLGAYARSVVGRLTEPGRTGEKDDLSSRILDLRATALERREVQIPVKYGGDEGPDLLWASEHLGMRPEEIVRRHSSPRYRVYMIGFSPGFPYLGGLDQSIAMPRLPAPRASVPPGSVGIAGSQTGIYPWESPGGWRIIGRTPLKLFDPTREDPSLLRPGDTVRFVPVDHLDLTPGRCVGSPGGEPPPTVGKLPLPGEELPPPGRELPSPQDELPLLAKSTPGGQLPRESGPSLRVPAFVVEHPGLFSIIVDAGRRRYRKLGVPVSGAADANSYSLANLLCGNKVSAPALEMTLWGVKMKALIDVVIAVTGAPCPVYLDGEPFSMNKPVRVGAGSVVEIGSPASGCRVYLAVSGGFSVPEVLGSATTYTRGSFGGYRGRSLLTGDVLDIGPGAWPKANKEDADHVPHSLQGWPDRLGRFLEHESPALRVVPGPECSSQDRHRVIESLCQRVFAVRNDSDRMGIRLEGRLPEGDIEGGDILSSPVVPGVLQLPSDGSPVLLLHDAQTSGGYKRIAAVVDADLPLAAQLRPGSRVRFTLSMR